LTIGSGRERSVESKTILLGMIGIELVFWAALIAAVMMVVVRVGVRVVSSVAIVVSAGWFSLDPQRFLSLDCMMNFCGYVVGAV